MNNPLQRYGNLVTVRDWLRYAVSRFNRANLFFGHGTDNAYDEAVYLILHALYLPPDLLDPFLDAKLLDSEREAVRHVIERRVNERVPAAYLTGESWLRGRRFVVDSHVLVPRSPIAEFLDAGMSPWIDDPMAVTRVMDMCTGSGCLAIIAAQAFPDALVDAVDVSEAALKVAQRNVSDYDLTERVRVLRSDLFADLPVDPVDLIICNPPYVNADSMAALPAEYQAEPKLALAGGKDGMLLVRRILESAPDFLTPGGLLLLEIGHERPHFEAAFPELEAMWLDSEATQDNILLLTREQLLAGRD